MNSKKGEGKEAIFDYHWLEEDNAIKQLQFFLSNSENTNIDTKDEDGNTVLHQACLFKHLNVISYLLKNGANVNLQDEEGQSPLHKASQLGYKDVVKILLDNNANVNIRDRDGWTPIHFAAMNEHKETCKVLVINGAKYDQRDKKRRTACELTSSKSIKNLFINLCEFKFNFHKTIRHRNVNFGEALNTIEKANSHTQIFVNSFEFTCYHIDKSHIWYGDSKGNISSFSIEMKDQSPNLLLESQFPVSDHSIYSIIEKKSLLWVSSSNKRLTLWDSRSNTKKNEMFYPSKQTNFICVEFTLDNTPITRSTVIISSSNSSPSPKSGLKTTSSETTDQIWAISQSDNSILAWNTKTFNFEFAKKIRVPHLYTTKNIQFTSLVKLNNWILLSVDRWVVIYDLFKSDIIYSFVAPEKVKGIVAINESNFIITYSSHYICVWEIQSENSQIIIKSLEHIYSSKDTILKVQFYKLFTEGGKNIFQVFVLLERMVFILTIPSQVISNIYDFGERSIPMFIDCFGDSFIVAVNHYNEEKSFVKQSIENNFNRIPAGRREFEGMFEDEYIWGKTTCQIGKYPFAIDTQLNNESEVEELQTQLENLKLTIYNSIGGRKKRRVVLREKYLRYDLSCRSFLCKQCNHKLPPLLSSDIPLKPPLYPLYIIPNFIVSTHFLEILEVSRVTNVIFLETIIKQIRQMNNSARIVQRIQAITRNTLKCSVIFQNETFKETNVVRSPNYKNVFGSKDEIETLENWQNRSMKKVSNFFKEHLENQSENPLEIVILNYTGELKPINIEGNIHIYESSLDSFIDRYYNGDSEILNLFESLKNVFESPPVIDNTLFSDLNQYPDHLSSSVLEAGLKSQIFYQGVINVNKYHFDEATVRISNEYAKLLGGDIFIPNKFYRNRAFHGDTVVVQLLPNDPQKDEKLRRGSGNAIGRVVGIIQRNWRLYTATIQEPDRLDMRKLIAIPFDQRIPKVRITVKNVEELLDYRLSIRIDDWPTHSQYPNGHYVSKLGKIGEIETETKALLIENSIPIRTGFSPNSVAHLPKEVKEWNISDKELSYRRDLRDRVVMSIDPIGCVDVDDALSVYKIPKKNKDEAQLLEVGVHIADVSYFVEHNSLLDREARERGTTVYFVDKRIDMLPSILSEQLCSLREGQDRYAMSVLWTIDEKSFEIKDIWYGRTIIHSRHEVHYQYAQNVIDDVCSLPEKEYFVKKSGNKREYEEVRESLRLLLRISKIFQRSRVDTYSLELQSFEVKFKLDEQKTPLDLQTKKELEVMKMVEVYMIMANIAVAKKIYERFPHSSLLRNHPPPRPIDFKELITAAARRGYFIDTSSNSALAKSLNEANNPNDPITNRVLRMIATKAMSEATYISTGNYENIEDFHHYGLDSDFYTHFTSPIRRYADIIVHRLLWLALEKSNNNNDNNNKNENCFLSNDELTNICEHINICNRNAKMAQRDSAEFFQSLYIKHHPNITENAIILNVKKNGLNVIIPKFGIQSFVFLRDKENNLIFPKNSIFIDGKLAENCEILDYSFDSEELKIILHTTKGDIPIIALDQIVVTLRVDENKTRLPKIKLDILHFGLNENKQDSEKLNTKELISIAINKANSQLHSKENIKSTAIKPVQLKKYSQSSSHNSVYCMFEKYAKSPVFDLTFD